jgi:hypothetical protein
MELITILSTIILIATISTFILSIGAYILFKIRSRREEDVVYDYPEPTKAELVTVNESEDFEKIRQNASRPGFQRVRLNNIKKEVEHPETRLTQEADDSHQERISSKRYVKYSADRQSEYNRDRSSGDLQWK